jgi:phospholipid transport system transporter-binding protein
MSRATAQLAERGEGRCAVAGELTLDTVPSLWQQLQASQLLAGAKAADLSAVTDADSAGVALLIAWRASCKTGGVDLQFSAIPARIIALAQLTGAEVALQGVGGG